MPSKRKHITLSIKQKSEIIERLDRGESGRLLAKEYGIGTSTISDIKRNKDKIKRFIEKYDSSPVNRKTLRKAEYPEMEIRLYAWFCTQRSRNIPISYEVLSAKAQQIFIEVYGNDNFGASRGWISNFRKRHGLRSLKVCGEKLFNDQGSIDPFLITFAEKRDLLPLQEINKTEAIYDSDIESSELKNTNKSVKHEEAVKSFNICIKWAEDNDMPLHDIVVLQRLQETAFLGHQKKNMKQTKITNYFTK